MSTSRKPRRRTARSDRHAAPAGEPGRPYSGTAAVRVRKETLTAPLVLSGQALELTDILEVAEGGRQVELARQARQRVAVAFEVVLDAVRARMPVYGLTTGVGWNK